MPEQTNSPQNTSPVDGVNTVVPSTPEAPLDANISLDTPASQLITNSTPQKLASPVPPVSAHERIRFPRLQQLCQKALEESIKSLTIEKFSQCYPTLASTVEGMNLLKVAREQVTNYWFNNSMREFNLIFQERGVEGSLDSLDELVAEARLRKQTYEEEHARLNPKFRGKKKQAPMSQVTPSVNGSELPVFTDELTPEEILASNLYATKKRKFEELQAIRDNLAGDNEMLLKELQGLSDASSGTYKDINNTVNDVMLKFGYSADADDVDRRILRGIDEQLGELIDYTM